MRWQNWLWTISLFFCKKCSTEISQKVCRLCTPHTNKILCFGSDYPLCPIQVILGLEEPCHTTYHGDLQFKLANPALVLHLYNKRNYKRIAFHLLWIEKLLLEIDRMKKARSNSLNKQYIHLHTCIQTIHISKSAHTPHLWPKIT